MHGQTDERTDKWTDQMDGRTDGQPTDGRTDGWTDNTTRSTSSSDESASRRSIMEGVGEEDSGRRDGRGECRSPQRLSSIYTSAGPPSAFHAGTSYAKFSIRTAHVTSSGRLRDGQPGGASVPSNQRRTRTTTRAVTIRGPSKSDVFHDVMPKTPSCC